VLEAMEFKTRDVSGNGMPFLSLRSCMHGIYLRPLIYFRLGTV
jgi:hypothetical protein